MPSKQCPYGWRSPTWSRNQARARFATQKSSTQRPASTSIPSVATARRMRASGTTSVHAPGASDAANGQVFNVGGLEPISHRDLVELLMSLAGSGRYRFVEWPPEKKAIDIGSFYADSSRARRTLGWQPVVPLTEGFTRTIEYYRTHMEHYVPAADTAVTAL